MLPHFRRLPESLSSFVENRPVLSLIIVVAYIVIPVDVLPELLLGPIGAFDDALVTIAAMSLLKRAAKARQSRPKPAAPPVEIERPKTRPESFGGGSEPRQGGDRQPGERRPDHPRRGDHRHRDHRRGRHQRPGDRRPGDGRPGDRRP